MGNCDAQLNQRIYIYIYIWLMVLTMLKILVDGKDYPIYYGKEKMFETTNQVYSCPVLILRFDPHKLGFTIFYHTT